MSYETFAPLSHGWRLLTDYRPTPVFNVAEEVSEIGTVKSTVISERVLQRFEGLQFRASTKAAYEYLMSFFARHVGPAGRFYWASPENIWSPDKAPTLEAVIGGSQPLRTVTVRYAWKVTSGTTIASPTASLSVPANNLVKVTVDPYPATVLQCVLYAADDDPGNEQEQTTLANVRTWTQPNSPMLLATADAPTTNTATKTPLVRLVGDIGIGRSRGTWYDATLTLEEVYTT